MQNFEEVLVVLIIFSTFGMMLKWYFDYRTRKHLIERGLVDERVKFLQFNNMDRYVPSSLKWGLVFLFVGVTIIILRVVSSYVPDEVVVGSMLIAAGLGLLAYYIIADAARKRQEKDPGESS